MRVRLITAGVAIVICVSLLVLGQFYPIVLNVALALLTILMVGELLTAKKLHKNMFVMIPCAVISSLIVLIQFKKFSNFAFLLLFVL